MDAITYPSQEQVYQILVKKMTQWCLATQLYDILCIATVSIYLFFIFTGSLK